MRLKGKLPGLYMIETNEAGERRFYHWRDASAVRGLMSLPETDALLAALADYDLIYLSAITLSLFDIAGRDRLIAALQRMRAAQASASPSIPISAPAAGPISIWRTPRFQDAFAVSDIVLASVEDLLPLYPGEAEDKLLSRVEADEVVLKLDSPASIIRHHGQPQRVEAEPVTGRGGRYHRGRRQFRCCLSARTSERRSACRRRTGRSLSRRHCRLPSRCDHPRAAMPDMIAFDTPSWRGPSA